MGSWNFPPRLSVLLFIDQPSIMKKIFILTILLSTMTFAFGQTNEKLTKEEKKAKKEAEALEAKTKIMALAELRQWVVEVNQAYDRDNNPYRLNSQINFAGVNGEIMIIQLGFDGLQGWNGVGGITLEGQVSKYEIKEGKPNKPVRIDITTTSSTLGTLDIQVTLPSGSQATIYINSISSGRLRLNGNLKSFEESKVHQGFRSR